MASLIGAGAALAEEAASVWIPGWQPGPNLVIPRTGHATLLIGDVLHAIGGSDDSRYLSQNEFARIGVDGSLGTWAISKNELNEGRAFHGVAQLNGFVYAVGGSRMDTKGLLKSVERAPILEDGSIGPWEMLPAKLNIARRCVHLAVIGNYIYAVGGFGGILLDSIERVEVAPDGSLGEWETMTDAMTQSRYVHGVKAIGDQLYVVGGHDKSHGAGINTTELAQQDEEGFFTEWQPSSPLAKSRYGLEVAVHGGNLYALSGIDGVLRRTSVEVAPIGDSGQIGDWRYTTPLPEPRGSFGTAVKGDRLYVLGGAINDKISNTVISATFNRQGDIGFWGPPEEAAKRQVEVAKKQFALEQKYPNLARVTEHIPAGIISFVNVQREDGASAWLAAPANMYTKGMSIRFPNGNVAANYYSKVVDKQFPVIMFVRDAQPVEGSDTRP